MKKTTLMKVIYSQAVPRGQLIMHPNEGFDLGLVTLRHSLTWCTNLKAEEFLQGQSGTASPVQIELLNECPKNSIQINASVWERLGMPDQAVVFSDGERIFLHGTKSKPAS